MMRLFVLVLAGLLVAAKAGRHHVPRLYASAMRINRLHHEIKDLEKEVEKAGKIEPYGFLMEMHARLDQVEGSECPKHEVQCGWQTMECVSELEVCDGQKDCHNGWDESYETCSHGAMEAGNVFAGMVRWHSCKPWGEHPISLKITSVVESKAYPSRLGVTAHGVVNIPHPNLHYEFDISGDYSYATRRLQLTHDIEHRAQLGFICDFNHGDDRRADCQIAYEASRHSCADMLLYLQHVDTHHTRHGEHDHRRIVDSGEVDHRGEIVEHHYDEEGHDHAEHFDKEHHRIPHADDDLV